MASALRLHEVAAWASLLTPAEFEVARAGVVEQFFPQGTVVSTRGRIFEYWVGVPEGMLKLRTLSPEGKEAVLTGVHGCGWFGEGAVIKNEPLRYDVVAMRDSRVMLMERAAFMQLFTESAAFNRFLVHQLNERVAQFIKMVEQGRTMEVTARVARGLAGLFNRTLYPHAGSHLEITQEEIGLFVGVSRPVVNRALKILQQEEVVNIEYGGVTVKDFHRLRTYVADEHARERSLQRFPVRDEEACLSLSD